MNCTCNIKKYTEKGFREFIPILTNTCKNQHRTKGNKHFQNKCYCVKKVLSGDDNSCGKVVVIETPKDSYVIKWNIDLKDRDNMLMELRLQNVASALGLAPKIIDYYADDKYFYIVMENLLTKGYKTVFDLYHNFDEDEDEESAINELYLPNEVLRAIAKALCKLHNQGISHHDAHPKNVFYNPKTKKVMFIDFGLSKRFASHVEALNYERYDWSSLMEYITDYEINTNWYIIKTYLHQMKGDCDSLKDRKNLKKNLKKIKKIKALNF